MVFINQNSVKTMLHNSTLKFTLSKPILNIVFIINQTSVKTKLLYITRLNSKVYFVKNLISNIVLQIKYVPKQCYITQFNSEVYFVTIMLIIALVENIHFEFCS